MADVHALKKNRACSRYSGVRRHVDGGMVVSDYVEQPQIGYQPHSEAPAAESRR